MGLSHSHTFMYALTHCRVKWVSQFGIKYTKMDYVLIGWQADDLPHFGRIDEILVTRGIAFLTVSKHSTFGIDRHFHSFCVKESHSSCVQTIPNLPHPNTFRARQMRDDLLITSRSHIIRWSLSLYSNSYCHGLLNSVQLFYSNWFIQIFYLFLIFLVWYFYILYATADNMYDENTHTISTWLGLISAV